MIRMDTTWPASATFWRHKRVIVTGPSAMLRTGGSGFLGSFVVDKLRERGATDITFALLSAGFIPRQRDYGPSTSLRAGPSTSLRAGPSTLLRAGPSILLRAGPSILLRAGLVQR